MSQIMRAQASRAIGLLALAVLALGCSKERGASFDPDAGHPDDFLASHSSEYRSAGESCVQCHGADLMGGIAKVSCYSGSFDGVACHPGGPGGHPGGWRATHTITDPALASTCAQCHDNPANSFPSNCFNNSLCHGSQSGHPAGWRSSHTSVNPAQAPTCAQCHDNPSNNLAPNCFNNSLCHGQQSPHPGGWRSSHTSTNPAQASTCSQCHDNPANAFITSCFNNSLCHGPKSNPHPSGWRGAHDSTSQSQASYCAGCHQRRNGTPGCFNNTLCHGNQD